MRTVLNIQINIDAEDHYILVVGSLIILKTDDEHVLTQTLQQMGFSVPELAKILREAIRSEPLKYDGEKTSAALRDDTKEDGETNHEN